MTDEERFRRAVEAVLEHEGGLVEDPADPGGLTNMGISLRAYPHMGPEGIRRLTREQAVEIYRRDWWERYGYARLPEPLAAKVFDLAVNMGPNAAHRILQRSLRSLGAGIAVDGILGPRTVEAAHEMDPAAIMVEVRAEAAYYYAQLAIEDPSRWRFLRGWLRRACA